MDKVFVDANYFIGLVNRTPETEVEILDKYECFVSALSCHILFYVNKTKVPDNKLNSYIDDFNLIELTRDILHNALQGPTSDLEDNIQLHSAAESESDYFLTNDEKLLKMKFFGKTKITDSLQR